MGSWITSTGAVRSLRYANYLFWIVVASLMRGRNLQKRKEKNEY